MSVDQPMAIIDTKTARLLGNSFTLEVHIDVTQPATFARLLECLRDIRLRKLAEADQAMWSISAPTQTQLEAIERLAPWLNGDTE